MEKARERLAAAGKGARGAAAGAAAAMRMVLAPPPPTTVANAQAAGLRPRAMSGSSSTTPATTTPAATTTSPTWGSWASAALEKASEIAEKATEKALIARARLSEKAEVARAALNARIDAASTAASEHTLSSQQQQQQSIQGAQKSSPGTALLARELAGLAKGSEIGVFDPKWRGLLEIFAATKQKKDDSNTLIEEERVGDTTTAATTVSAATITVQRYLALTRDRLLVLAPHPTRLGAATVKSNHHLTELGKATFSRKSPGRITVFYRRADRESDSGGVILIPRVYVLEDVETAEAFMASLQGAVAALCA